ncbi:MAG: hypothetical protein HY919_02185 [Elusimicrobia bacterium]|nr:hypothetical protein [Elusimicrobiota bacterium]
MKPRMDADDNEVVIARAKPVAIPSLKPRLLHFVLNDISVKICVICGYEVF